MKTWRFILFLFCGVACSLCFAQTEQPRQKHVLVIGEEKGYRHESVTHAMATIDYLGRETGSWDTTIRTDTEALTKKKLEYNAKNLNDFDAVIFFTGGTLEMDAQQKADFLSFVHDDGKGFIGIHSAAITFTDWPEYGEMVGGCFDEHPWGTFDASKLDLRNPRVHRADHDFAVTWAKMYGKGRVYYSTLGHQTENWNNPQIQKMYAEAIKWATRQVDADVKPRPAPAK